MALVNKMAHIDSSSIEGVGNYIKFNYSNIKSISMGKSVSSPIFIVGEHEWCIKYYPAGTRDEAFISLFLQLRCKAVEVKTVFDLYLLDKNGKPSPTTWETTSHNFRPGYMDWGYSCFIKRTDLETNYIDIKGCFIVACMIKLEGLCKQVLQSTSLGISRDFRNLMENKELADVIFEVEEERFVAHRIVLAARSPVFKAELFGYMAESRIEMKAIMIKDMQSDVFKSLLHFIYTDSIPKSNDKNVDTLMAQHLFVAADRYAIEELKLICQEKLCDDITIDTVTSTLVMADKYNCAQLKNDCLEFIALPKNRLDLGLNEDYIQLISSSPLLLNEIRARVHKHSII